MKLGLILRTLSHLRREQLIYRPIRLLQRHLDRTILAGHWKPRTFTAPVPTASATEKISGVVALLPHLTQPLAQYESLIRDLEANRFTFLNQTVALDRLNWNERYGSHLWSYNLQYFGWSPLCARAYIERHDDVALQSLKRLVSHWISEAQPGRGDAWEPYPISLRIVNWAYAYSLLSRLPDSAFLSRWASSIRDQLRYLHWHIEYHLLANHIIKNAKALIVGGLLFGDEIWITAGRGLLLKELDEQVLEDGGHFERAPMYHAQVLGDALESVLLLKAFGQMSEFQTRNVEKKVASMASFLAAMTNADGTLALFNDSANTEDLAPRPLLASAEQVIGKVADVASFPSSGYFTWTSSNRDERIVVDAGPPAADYNTAHAHCDLLSYELWLNGHPFIVDSGVHGYEGDPFREYARSTRAHNTVMIDGREQSEVWATFRVGSRATRIRAEARGDTAGWRFHGSYSPHFDNELTHERRIERSGDGTWSVVDRVSGWRGQRAESFIHLHPDVRASTLEGSKVVCESAGRRVVIEPFGFESIELYAGIETPPKGWYFPDFGIARPSQTVCLATRLSSGQEFGYSIRVEWLRA